MFDFRVVDGLELSFDYEITPFGHEVPLDWDSVPAGVQPDVPESRLQRKREQLENLAKAIIKVKKTLYWNRSDPHKNSEI